MHCSQARLGFWSWLVYGSVAMAAPPGSQDFAALLGKGAHGWSSETVVSYPGSSTFENSTERWSIYAPPSYQVAISPATEADVVQAVELARRFKIPFLATGGRHGYSTSLGELQDGLAIDLSKLNSVSINKTAATLTIGPGVRFRDIFDPVYDAGFEIQTGTCSCVGMMGATLAGGIGRLHGVHGLIIDALISVRLVMANGQIVEASQTKNPDLFWGIRGAGQNFGIVIEATYELHPLRRGGVWTTADLILTGDKNVSYFDTVAGMLPIPAELTVETILTYNDTLEQPQLMLSLLYAGPQEEAVEAISPILSLEPSYSDIKEIRWNQISTETTFMLDSVVCMPRQIFDSYGVNMRDFPASTFVSSFEKMATFWAEQPAGRNSFLTMETWPIQATVAVADDATAYPWRDTTTYIMVQFRWDTIGDPVQEVADTLGPEIRSDLAAASGYGDLAVYMNYAWSDETPEQIYGKSKLPRLVDLKTKYDPDNVFRFYNGLPTSYP